MLRYLDYELVLETQHSMPFAERLLFSLLSYRRTRVSEHTFECAQALLQPLAFDVATVSLRCSLSLHTSQQCSHIDPDEHFLYPLLSRPENVFACPQNYTGFLRPFCSEPLLVLSVHSPSLIQPMVSYKQLPSRSACSTARQGFALASALKRFRQPMRPRQIQPAQQRARERQRERKREGERERERGEGEEAQEKKGRDYVTGLKTCGV